MSDATNLVDTPPTAATFDLAGQAGLTFQMLLDARATVFRGRAARDSFDDQVRELPADGEAGRRKGLGLWMLARHEEAERQLAPYAGDDVASFTRARALCALGRWSDALAIFQRLSKSYAKEPRPRAGAIECRLELGLAAGESADALAKELRAAVAAGGPEFAAHAEARTLLGRAHEITHAFEAALDEYSAARAADPTHRANLFRLAFLAERSGLEPLALRCYEELAGLPPVDAAALSNLGLLYEDLGRHEEAAQCYETLAASYPADARARLYLDDARAGVSMYYDEEQEKKEDRLNQVLRIPITDFELSVRARNCLAKMNITVLGDLVSKSEPELLSYKNFGETSLNEIKEILGSKGLRLGMTREEAAAAVEIQVRRIATSSPGDAGNRPISELKLSIRARRAVESLGCLTVGDVTKHSAEELLGMPNFGQTSLAELRGKLTELNLKLRDE
jgi:DNA-directed RNA polymerase subunit alpha